METTTSNRLSRLLNRCVGAPQAQQQDQLRERRRLLRSPLRLRRLRLPPSS